MRHHRLAPLIVVVSIGLAACGSNGTASSVVTDATVGSSSGTDGASSAEAGRTYLSTSVTGLTLLEGTRVVISFDTRGNISADAGCNSMGSGYAISDGHLRLIGPVGSTVIGCPGKPQAQDEWLFALLGSKPTITIAGDTLVITGDTATITLLDKKTAEPDYPLIGTRWLVETILQSDSASTPPQGATGWVLFNADGTINASFGCNTASGTYTSTASDVTISALETTKLPCPSEAAQLETPMLDALSGPVVVDYTISADALTLTSRGGPGLGLRAEQHP